MLTEINLIESLEGFNTQGLANTANCAVKLFKYTQENQSDERILALEVLSKMLTTINLRGGLERFNVQDLVSTANCAVKFFKYTEKNQDNERGLILEVLNKVFTAINLRESLEDFNAHKLANVARCIAQLCCCAPELLEKINEAMYKHDSNEFNLQNISNLAWAFSVTGQNFSYEWMEVQLLRLFEQEKDKFNLENANQLYRVFLKRALIEKTWNATEPDAFLKEYLPEAICSKIHQFKQSLIKQMGYPEIINIDYHE